MICLRQCAGVALALMAGAGAWALPTLTNLSAKTWTLGFDEHKDRVKSLELDHPLCEETVVTVTWPDGHSQRMTRAGRHGHVSKVAIGRRETVFFTFRGKSRGRIQEILTLEDHTGSREHCSIMVMNPSAIPAKRAAPVFPTLVVHLNDSFARAKAFFSQGVVLKGTGQISILARTYAEVLGDTALSPVQEVAEAGTPAAEAERKLPPAPAPLLLPAAAAGPAR